MTTPRRFLYSILLTAGLISTVAQAQPGSNPSSAWFTPNPEWSSAADAKIVDGKLQATPDKDGPVIAYTGKKNESLQLRTFAYLGDCVVSMEFLAPAGADA